MIPMLILLCGFLGFFFCSIYIGATYLHDHLQVLNDLFIPSNDQLRNAIFATILQDEKWGNTIGLPGTRNVIQKWSLSHLGGIDLTTLGPPVKRAEAKADAKFENPFHFKFQFPFGKHDLTKSEEEGEITPDQVENLETAELVPQPGHQTIDKSEKEEVELQIPRGEISVEEAGNVAILAGVGSSEGATKDDMDADVKKEESLDRNSDGKGESEEDNEPENETESDGIDESAR